MLASSSPYSKSSRDQAIFAAKYHEYRRLVTGFRNYGMSYCASERAYCGALCPADDRAFPRLLQRKPRAGGKVARQPLIRTLPDEAIAFEVT